MEETKIDKKVNYNISIDDMIVAGLSYGHDKSKLNPKMKDNVIKQKDRISLINLEKTAEGLASALDFIAQVKSEGKSVLFVGTKVATRELVRSVAIKCDSPYVVERWIGGLFTNFKEIRKRINYFKDLEVAVKEEDFEKKFVKKERLKMLKEIERLQIKFGGVKNMEELPGAIFIVDVEADEIALREAIQSSVKIVSIADTNINPDEIDFPIPGNDDAYSAVEYILYKIEEALN